MKIIGNEWELSDRILINDSNTKINISNDKILKYTGVYYKIINNEDPYERKIEKIITKFVGRVDSQKYRYHQGVTGIYITPLFIYIDDEWNKITDFKICYKYFWYPHLLALPETNLNYACYALYYLDTIEPVDLNEFQHITNKFILDLHM